MVGDLSPLAAPARPFRLLVAGVGGAGCRALRALDAPGVEAVAIHTDAQALSAADTPRRIQIGSSLVHGASTGGDAFTGALVVVLTVLGALVPFLLVLAPLALIVWVVVQRNRRRVVTTP